MGSRRARGQPRPLVSARQSSGFAYSVRPFAELRLDLVLLQDLLVDLLSQVSHFKVEARMGHALKLHRGS